ncbi:transcriptional regulator [Enterobacteriaceae bacterium C34A]
MVYLIDSRLIFRVEDGAMWPSGDEGAAVILTLTMSRLLTFLLDRQGEVITRNELLSNVWDAHGLRSSSHTLNKYISVLRKYFVEFGIAGECISTLPRVGFMFNREIEVRVIAEAPHCERAPTINNGLLDSQVIQRAKQPGKYKAIYYAFVIVIVFSSAALVWSGLAFRSEPPRRLEALTPHYLFNFGNCPVYTVENNSASLAELKKKLFLDLAESNQIHCLEGASFLYQVSEAYLYGKQGRAFISRCTQKDSDYISCLNNYWSGYERRK